jgi:hypothetical protein
MVTDPARSLRIKAILKLANRGYGYEFCEMLVDLVLEELMHPDAHMLAAGLDELNLAMGPKQDSKHGDAYRRDLARVIWSAMLDRAR